MSGGGAGGGRAGRALEIVEAGPLMLVEDSGRPGFAHLGVSRSGAADRAAWALGNRLVGNRADAASLEITLGPFELRFSSSTWFALTGAWGEASLDGHSVDPYGAVLAGAGSTLRVEGAQRGLRYYLAARGGIATPVTLGSRSIDTLSGVGGKPLTAGQVVPLGGEPSHPVPQVDTAVVAAPPDGPVELLVHEGPRADWFTMDAWEAFTAHAWVVSARANRIGVGLEAPGDAMPLERARGDELPSEAMVAGAVQVTHSGMPTVLFADHPVTGGYPVIAVVDRASLDRLGQVRPGQPVRFRRAV